MPIQQVPITPDELRRAFTRTYLAAQKEEARHTEPGSYEDDLDEPDEADEPDDLPEMDEAEKLAWAKEDALRRRVLMLLMWLMQGDSEPLVFGRTPIGVPDIHEAVFEVAASLPLPISGLPKPGPFFRELEARVKAHSVLSGRR